jgi:ribosomal-protein-alanine N-acetyltransferase
MKESKANIVTIDIDPLFQKRGIGTKLIVAVKKVLLDLLVKKITLQVAEDNNKAVNFYLKHGFKVVKRLPSYYPDTDGYQMECMIR